MSRHAPAQPRRSSLPVLATAQLLIALDFSIVYVALPSIGRSLRFDAAGLQWVVTAYTLAFAGLLLLAGRLVDVVGARTLFLAGLAVFGLALLVAGLATRPGLLIAMRAAQGVGAAMLAPSTLALLAVAYPAGEPRNRALAVWGTTGAAGLAIGALVGGLLTSISWHLVFLAVAPLALITLLLAPDRLPRAPRPITRPSLDIVGALVGTAGVTSVVLGLSQAVEAGWASARSWLPVAIGVALLSVLAGWERLTAEPFLSCDLLRLRSLQLGSAIAALFMASLGAEFFLLTLYLQHVRGYDPVDAGLAFLPLALVMTVGNAAAGRLIGRIGLRWLLAAAFAWGAGGLFLLAWAAASGAGFWTGILPALLIGGLGQGIAFTGMFVAGTSDLPSDQHGTGAALVTTVQHVGGSIAIAGYVLLLGHSGRYAEAFAVAAVLALTAGALALRFPPLGAHAAHGGVGVPDLEVRR